MHFLVLLSALVACATGVPLNTTKPTKDGRIVGGNPAEIEQHPHQVAVLYFGSFWCGGSIISPTCVVTAASCVIWMSTNSLTIRAGSIFNDFGGTIHQVRGGFYHGNYNSYNYDYDVAVLRVDPPFTYSDTVQNIALQNSEIHPGTSVVVTGWGATWSGGPNTYSLHEAYINIAYDYQCAANSYYGFTDRMICTEPFYGGIGPCNGDTGGPLSTIYCPRRLVGIVSWTYWDCGYSPFPAVYTKVSAVREWIINLCNTGIIPNAITKVDAIP